MKLYVLPFFICALLFGSCVRHEEVKAFIFERKELRENRLQIKYRYSMGSRIYKDSTVIISKTIIGDSISIIVNPDQPGRALPVIENATIK